MKISTSARFRNGKILVDIHISDMDATSLPSLHADEIRDMARPQIESLLREIEDSAKRKEFAKAIVDGIPMSRPSSPEDKSDGQVPLNGDMPPHTEVDS